MTTDVINGVPRSLLERVAERCALVLSVADGEQLSALLATAQPACDTCNGHGLIGGFVNAESGYESQLCPDCTAQPAADGEREAFEAWMREEYAADDDMLKKPYEGRYFYGKPANMWDAWQARAAQPQQAVAGEHDPMRQLANTYKATAMMRAYEVRRLREALDEAAQSLEAIRNGAGLDEFMKDSSDVRSYARSRAMVARAALSAHKTGEEE